MLQCCDCLFMVGFPAAIFCEFTCLSVLASFYRGRRQLLAEVGAASWQAMSTACRYVDSLEFQSLTSLSPCNFDRRHILWNMIECRCSRFSVDDVDVACESNRRSMCEQVQGLKDRVMKPFKPEVHEILNLELL